MRLTKTTNDAQFESWLQFAIDYGVVTDSVAADTLFDIFSRIHKADKAEREPLIAIARERWRELKKELPEYYID